ncbi:MAG: phosphoribosylamine--glycine ligase [Endomicrobium sp.]|jgi:phosphoribosylamine--glycine ligase|nr:phosphoribosylamine--glycine ligase [Endomicrobium sp.]
MNVLVIGSGGREHAICSQFSKSCKVKDIFCIPGNSGISKIAKIVNIPIDNFELIVEFVKRNKIDITFVGQEVPLALGIVDYFKSHGLQILGPSMKAAMLESSKTYAKLFMNKYNIPTAQYKSFLDMNEAINFLSSYPINKKIVIKADGLASGKGVYVCDDTKQGKDIIIQMMSKNLFGNAGKKLIVEEYIEGQEFSYLVFIDGTSYSVMPVAKDHKKLNDNDKGLNTGGMGSFAPIPLSLLSNNLDELIKKTIIQKTVEGILNEKLYYKGILYIGIIVDNNNIPYVLEYNCRFGDPETQVLLPLLNTDLLDISISILNGNLSTLNISWKNKYAVCVILASGGYPERFVKRMQITGLDRINDKDIYIFHSGTELINGKFFTVGGRVLGVTSIANTLHDSAIKAYNNIHKIYFKNMHYRHDIGLHAGIQKD